MRKMQRHPFSLALGDRARHSRAEALRLAEERALRRGRQTVRLHRGWVSRLWYVQDVR
jgi:hypothetical protein